MSADVRLSTKAHNILEKDGNTLYVKGTTDNLYHAGEVLETYLNELSADLQAKYTELANANSDLLTSLTNKISQEISDRKDADTALNTAISDETKRAEVAEGKNTDAINSETKRAKAAEEANAKLIQTQGEKLDTEIQRSTQKDTDLEAKITANTKLLTTLTVDVSDAEKAISAEQARALSVEQSLQSAIDSEKNRAKAAEEANAKLIQSLDGKLSAEVTRSTEKDAELAQQIQNVVHPEYTITKQTTPNEGCIATFILTKNNTPVGSAIDVPLINLDVTYERGLMTFKVGGKTVKQFNIGVSDVVKSAVYNSDAKQLEFVFNLENGGTQSKNISLSGLVGTLDSEINVVKTDLATETSERKSKDSALESKIDAEITRAKEKDEALGKSITDEIARAKAAEEALAGQAAADYTLTESQSTDPQYKGVYNLTKNGIATGATIKVPKAMTIKTEDKSLVFTPNTDNPSEVSAKVNIKAGGGINLDDNGLSVDNSALTKYTGSNAVSVQDADGTNTKKIVLVLDPDSEDYLSITGNGLKLAGIQALAEKLDELDWAEPDA